MKLIVQAGLLISAVLLVCIGHAAEPLSKLDIYPSYTSKNKNVLIGENLALDFLKQNKAKYYPKTNIDDIKLENVRSSLLADHYYFQQYLNGMPVDQSHIIVSLSKNNQVSRVFNNIMPVSDAVMPLSKKRVSDRQALEKAWGYLQASGKLHAQPKSNLVYIQHNGGMILVHKINLVVDTPRGSWVLYINANNYDVISAHRIDIRCGGEAHVHGGEVHKHANRESSKLQTTLKSKRHRSLDSALAELALSSKNRNKKYLVYDKRVDVTALVFDPDPRTTLSDETLEDDSPPSSFDGAYLTRTLKDVTLENGVYSLKGPWVSVVNFEAPNLAPSTTTDGQWLARRGDTAFNDAMTYYHIDKNQRYIQSLGFVGSTGIQQNSIQVDTNGLRGNDQSQYYPGLNRLSFGHGCVDDNEDADVILHEYGHAITFSINPNFVGGDSGAIGEGFGDYWAASYSYSTPNGLSFRPEWVFTWDGHSSCWSGRRVDTVDARYDPEKQYGAHQIVDGVNADELWSTAIVQPLLELINDGVSRSEVDQIILEAQFGLGSDITMREMAQSIVDTAKELFPNGSHASVFDARFKQMNILEPEKEDSGSLGWLLLMLVAWFHRKITFSLIPN